MKRILIAVAVIAAIAYLVPKPEAEPVKPPEHRISIESLSCQDLGTKSRAFVTIRNTGDTTIDYPNVSVRIGTQVGTSYASPYPLRPGGIAESLVYNTSSGAEPCEILAITDSDGYSAAIRQP